MKALPIQRHDLAQYSTLRFRYAGCITPSDGIMRLRLVGPLFMHLFLALSLLWGGSTAFTAKLYITNASVSSHCAAPQSEQHQLPAPDCLAHCTLPARTLISAAPARFSQVWQATLASQHNSRSIAPPSPPPKTFSV